MIIGLHGVAEAGKDVFADYLVEKYGFEKYGFADQLRRLAIESNPIVHITNPEHYNIIISQPDLNDPDFWKDANIVRDFSSGNFTVYCRLADALKVIPYDELKKNPSVRQYYQDLGLGARFVFGQDFWVNEAWKEVGDLSSHTGRRRIVFKDVRFDNEAISIHRKNGYVYKIDAGLPPVNDHISDAGISEHLLAGTVLNNKSKGFGYYYATIDVLMAKLGIRKNV